MRYATVLFFCLVAGEVFGQQVYRPGDTYYGSLHTSTTANVPTNADALPTVAILRNGAADGAWSVTVVTNSTSLGAGEYTMSGVISSTCPAYSQFELIGTAIVGTNTGKSTIDKFTVLAGLPLTSSAGDGQLNVSGGKAPATLAVGDIVGTLNVTPTGGTVNSVTGAVGSVTSPVVAITNSWGNSAVGGMPNSGAVTATSATTTNTVSANMTKAWGVTLGYNPFLREEVLTWAYSAVAKADEYNTTIFYHKGSYNDQPYFTPAGDGESLYFCGGTVGWVIKAGAPVEENELVNYFANNNEPAGMIDDPDVYGSVGGYEGYGTEVGKRWAVYPVAYRNHADTPGTTSLLTVKSAYAPLVSPSGYLTMGNTGDITGAFAGTLGLTPTATGMLGLTPSTQALTMGSYTGPAFTVTASAYTGPALSVNATNALTVTASSYTGPAFTVTASAYTGPALSVSATNPLTVTASAYTGPALSVSATNPLTVTASAYTGPALSVTATNPLTVTASSYTGPSLTVNTGSWNGFSTTGTPQQSGVAVTLPTTAPANWIAALSISANALDGKGDWSVLNTDDIDARLDAFPVQKSGSTNPVTLPTIPNNWITATGINAGALDSKGNWTTVGAKMDLADVLSASGVASLKSQLGTVPASGNWSTLTQSQVITGSPIATNTAGQVTLAPTQSYNNTGQTTPLPVSVTITGSDINMSGVVVNVTPSQAATFATAAEQTAQSGSIGSTLANTTSGAIGASVRNVIKTGSDDCIIITDSQVRALLRSR